MKYIQLFICFLVIGCGHKNDQHTQSYSIADTLFFDEHRTLQAWVAYYTEQVDSDFVITKFRRHSLGTFDTMEGTVWGIFDENYDEVYNNFLIFSPSKEWYLDIDSYQWQLSNENQKELIFDVDQEINLVHPANKTVERIAFRGSSSWVEDAYWRNDSTVVLLENSLDKIPSITVMDLKSNTQNQYRYNDTLANSSEYTFHRIQSKQH
jgi:hypothetical protein